MPIETANETWREVEKLAKKEQETAVGSLIAAGVSEREADFHRGVIYAMEQILDLGRPKPETPAAPKY